MKIANKYLDHHTGQPMRLDALDRMAQGWRGDEAPNMFFLRQLTEIEATFYETKHAPRLGRQFVPTFSKGLGPWTESYGYRMLDWKGKAKRAASHSDDVPLVNVHGNETFQRFQMYTLGMEYTIDEIAMAARVNVPLEAERAKQVKNGLDQMIDDIIAEGDSTAGLGGFANMSGTDTFSLTTKAATGTKWLSTAGVANATPDEIIRDLTQMRSQVRTNTHATEMVTKILLSPMLYAHVNNTPRSTISDTTIKKFFEDANPECKLEEWERLTDLSGHAHRIIGYNPTVDNVCLLMAIEFELRPPEPKNFAYYVPARMKTGGVISKYPKSIIFADGAVA